MIHTARLTPAQAAEVAGRAAITIYRALESGDLHGTRKREREIQERRTQIITRTAEAMLKQQEPVQSLVFNEVVGFLLRVTSSSAGLPIRNSDVSIEKLEEIASPQRAPMLFAIVRSAGFILEESPTSVQFNLAKVAAVLAEIGQAPENRPVRDQLRDAVRSHGPG